MADSSGPRQTLADCAGLALSTVHALEVGTLRPDCPTIHTLARAPGVAFWAPHEEPGSTPRHNFLATEKPQLRSSAGMLRPRVGVPLTRFVALRRRKQVRIRALGLERGSPQPSGSTPEASRPPCAQAARSGPTSAATRTS